MSRSAFGNKPSVFYSGFFSHLPSWTSDLSYSILLPLISHQGSWGDKAPSLGLHRMKPKGPMQPVGGTLEDPWGPVLLSFPKEPFQLH